MAQYVIGDIHGCFAALDCLVWGLDCNQSDTFVTLGDYVDRGPDSKKVLDWLIEMDAQGRLVALRGNHEELMLNARLNYLAFEGWLMSGGRQTLKSFNLPLKQSSLLDIPDRYWNFLENTCKLYHEDEHSIFVHANVNADLPLEHQDPHQLVWSRFKTPIQHCSGKVVVCGHTAQQNGLPKSFSSNICIDSWVYGNGWLTALEMSELKFWQANQDQLFRKGWIHGNRVWVYPQAKQRAEIRGDEQHGVEDPIQDSVSG